VYAETVLRDENMHVTRFPQFEKEIREAFAPVYRQEVLPSMRSLQFSGEAILKNHCKLFNCCFGHTNRLEAFSEAMYLLLCGCGVGYSIQREHVECLPVLTHIDTKRVKHHVVEDTIEGWADAEKALVMSYTTGEYVEFAFHKIRNAGSLLRTSGGRAPGHIQLKKSLELIRGILNGAQGRQLRPIECHRIYCVGAEAPLSGGVRRSAMIALFSLDDQEMMNCKTGDWYSKEPYLQNANNSVVLVRGEVREKEFRRVFESTRHWGEPGFFFTWNAEWGGNPCMEVTFDPRLIIDEKIQRKLAKKNIQVDVGDVFSGWAFCNLTTINAAKLRSLDDFLAAAKAATFIGTLQATYTSFPYLGWISEAIAERDALLGVSMTGMLDSPAISCNPEYQQTVARHVKSWNRQFAEMFGIEAAARTTLVKPEGTSSLALGGVASGHHAHHARRYIRRVIADQYEPVFQAFQEKNPHMCKLVGKGKWIIEFPVEIPPEALVKADLTAIEFLEMVGSTQKNWVGPGTNLERTQHHFGEPLTHNVSNTVHVRKEEWSQVADYLWEHRNSFSGVSFIEERSDKQYANAPFEAVITEADEAYFHRLLDGYTPLDYSSLREEEDGTTLRSEAACAGGACEVNI
jgi:ribonucleoside-diphosphate reductase alpha chain